MEPQWSFSSSLRGGAKIDVAQLHHWRLISPSPPCMPIFYHHFFRERYFQLFSNHSTTSRVFKVWGSHSHILLDFLVVLLSGWWSIFGWLMIKSAGLTSPSDRAIHPTDTPPQSHTGRLNNLCTILNMKEDLTLQSPPAPFPFSLDRWDGQTVIVCSRAVCTCQSSHWNLSFWRLAVVVTFKFHG